ncbi:MAG: ABC transporter ATP-binding protein [Burkholderiaceae bacterium]|nr:ABC transporter ATP-binding protein [Burkholderiaceae bacterium]
MTARPGSSSAPILQVSGLSKRFGARCLLHDIDLRVDAGERVMLLGESGSGKSTLLNLIAGLECPDEGRISIDGEPVDASSPDRSARLRREKLGFVFQAYHLLPHLDATQNVAVPLLLLQVSPTLARERARAMLARVGLSKREHAMPATLSGGEQQRVALARALVHEPVLLLADEPTGNLDPRNAARALSLMLDQVARTHAALLMVTHSEAAAASGDRSLRLALDDELGASLVAGSTDPTS